MISFSNLSITENVNEIEDSKEEIDEDEGISMVTTMALLMGGTFFLLFGFLLYFFSNNGYFVLRWSNSYWFVYLFVALPMLYFGIQNLKSLKE